MDYFVANSFVAPAHMAIQNQPGAVPVKNGQNIVPMKKERRIPRSIFSSEEESGGEDFLGEQGRGPPKSEKTTGVPELHTQIAIREESDSLLRHNYDDDDQSRRRLFQELDLDLSSDDEELCDQNIERRSEMIKQRQEEEFRKDAEEETSDNNSDDSSEYEESTDSEEEMVPLLKPVFEPERERIKATEKEKKAQKEKQAIIEAHKLVQERKMGIQNKAGAVPVKNGQNIVPMKKVRRMPRSIFSSEEESGGEDFLGEQGRGPPESENTTGVLEPNKQIEIREKSDSLLRHNDGDDDQSRRRKIQELEVSDPDEISGNLRKRIKLDLSESSDEEELCDQNIERRSEMIKPRQEEEEFRKDDEEETSDNSSDDSSEYEESTDSEEEMVPLLKPVFEPEREKIKATEKEKKAQKEKQAIIEAQKLVQEQKMIKQRQEEEEFRKDDEDETSDNSSDDSSEYEESKDSEEEMAPLLKPVFEPKREMITVTEKEKKAQKKNDELEYEPWNLRELKRKIRDLEEQESAMKERLEVERLRKMTEEEKRKEALFNPGIVILLAMNGKYGFLRKYYPRGVF